MSTAKRTTLCAMCIALCYVLPIAFHSVGLGSILSPLHIPVLLCGLVCGPLSGLLCGIIGPCLSSLLSGMPPVVMLVRMIPELCFYGLTGGLMMKIHSGRTVVDVYVSLAVAMIAGRVVGGIASAIYYIVTTNVYSVGLWVTSYFIEAVPGIIAHLILVPVLYMTLERSRVIPARYVPSET